MSDRITVELILDDSGFTTRTMRAGRAISDVRTSLNGMGRAMGNAERHSRSFGKVFRDITITMGLARHALVNLRYVMFDWQKSIITANAELERLEKLLFGMSKSSDREGKVVDAANDMKFLIEMARTAPFSVKELANTMVKFRSVGIDPTVGSMRALVEGVAQFGGSDQILHRATVAIQQMAGKGVISMEELRQQLGEAIPNAIPLMARSMRMTMGELVNEISKGRVEAVPALDRMLREFERQFEGASARMMSTFTGLVSRLGTEWMLFLKQIGDTGYFKEVKKELENIVVYFSSGGAQEWADRIGAALLSLVQNFKALAVTIYDNWGKIVAFGKAAIAAFLAYKYIGLWVPAIRAVSIAIRTMGAAVAMASTSVGRIQAQFIAGAVAARGFAAASAMAGRAMAALGGPIGIFITLISAIGLAWLATASDTESAIDRIKVSVHGLTGVQIAAVEAERALLGIDVIKAEHELKMANADQEEGWYKRRSVAQKKYNDLQESALDIDTRLAAAKNSRVTVLDSEGRLRAEQAVSSRMIGIRADYEKTLTGIDEKRKKANKKVRAELDAEQLSATKSRYDAERVIILDEQQKTENVLAALKGKRGEKAEGERRVALSKQAKFNEKLRANSESAANAIKDALPPELLAGSTGTALSAAERYMKSLQLGAAGAEAKVGGLNDKLAKFRKEIELGTKDGVTMFRGVEVDSKWITNAEELIEKTHGFKEALDSTSSSGGRLGGIAGSLGRKFAVFSERINEARLDLETGFSVSSRAIRGVRALQTEVGALNGGLGETSRRLSALENIAITAEAMERAVEYRDAARDISRSLMSERDAVIDRYEEEITLANEVLAILKRNAPQEVAAINAVTEAISLQAKAINVELAGSWGRMSAEWGDIMGQLQNSTGAWANGFSDALVDMAKSGEMAFGDLAESILEDMLRIMLQALI